jgi:type II secretory pathway component PulL
MNTAIAAALRISTGKKSFNFRQGDFAAKNTGLNFKKQLKWAGIIAGIIIALAIFNQLFDYGLNTKRLNVLKKQIAYTFKKNYPEAASMVDPVQQLRSRLAENKKTFGFYEDLPETTVIEIMKEISGLVPSSVNIVMTGLTYEKGVISLKGEAQTIDDVTSIKSDLSKSKYFKNVTMGSTSLTKDGGKVDFSLRIEVK